MRKVVGFAVVLSLFLYLVIASFAHEKVDAIKERAAMKTENSTAQSQAGLTIESFEGDTFPPEGWRKMTNFDGTGWSQAAVDSPVVGFARGTVDAPPGGGSFVALASWVTGDADGDLSTDQATDQWLITPKITNLQPGDSLSFYLRYFDRFGDTLDVWVSTADSIPSGADTVLAAFDTLVTKIAFAGPGNNEWQHYSFDLTDFVDTGSDVFIGFREHVAHNSAEGDALFLDLVEVRSLVTSLAAPPVGPTQFQLLQNYPNPFNPSTRIRFILSERSEVTLRIYNLLGNEVETLADREFYSPGQHELRFDASGLPNGIYYYRMKVGGLSRVGKMTLVK